MGIEKSMIRFIRSLAEKKTRDQEGLFLAEGEKIVAEALLSGSVVEILVATESWFTANHSLSSKAKTCIQVSSNELERISQLKTPNHVLAVIKKENHPIDFLSIQTKLSLVIDGIQDPGNLGTILRIADWYGIEWLICSEHSADVYNPKVIQSSMGAFLRVKSAYTHLPTFLSKVKTENFEIFGALLEGDNLYQVELNKKGIIIMGNESKGIDPNLFPYITKKITIPGYPPGKQGAESLNVAVATGIICAEFRRRG